MKETTFYIILNIRTANGFESTGKFFIGNDREFARATFMALKGDDNVDEKTMLSLELRETVNGLPVNMQIISCTLDQVAENCKIITKEAFRLFNLKDSL
jgi:hypothetical protein